MSTSNADFALVHESLDKLQQQWQQERAQLTNSADRAWREVRDLRAYLNEQMRGHFNAYNGGQREQLHRFSELCLPLPWVPSGVKGFSDTCVPSHYEPAFRTITYVEERRMVPLMQAGKI